MLDKKTKKSKMKKQQRLHIHFYLHIGLYFLVSLNAEYVNECNI